MNRFRATRLGAQLWRHGGLAMHDSEHGGHGRKPGRGRGHGRGHGGHGPRGGGFPFGPPFGGPGFGPFGGPGFGPFGGGPRRGRGRRNRGDVRLAVLALLVEGPKHGYQLIQEIAERSEGAWRASAGSVYPVLQQLEDEGLVRIERIEGRRVVTLTEAGTAYTEEQADALAAVFSQVNDEMDDGLRELFGLMQQTHMAAMQVAQAGTPNQVAKARQVLERSRQALYQVLAAGDPGDDADGEAE